MLRHQWFSLYFRDLEKHAKENEEKMKKLKEGALPQAKKEAKKDTKEPSKRKSAADMKEVLDFHIQLRVQLLKHAASHSKTW